MIDITELRAEYDTLYAAAQKFSDHKNPTEDEKKADDVRFAKMDEIKSTIEREERLTALAFAQNSISVRKPAEHPGKTEMDKVEGYTFADYAHIEVKAGADRQQFGKDFIRWITNGPEANKFATITTATQSGIFLPVSVLQPLTPAALNAFRQGYASWGIPTMETLGDTSTFNVPIIDAVAGGVVAENASSEVDGTPTLSNSIVSACKTYGSGSVYYSNMELSATKYDLLAATVPAMDYSKELGLESAMVSNIVDNGSLVVEPTLTSTTSGFTFANLNSWDQALPKKYQQIKVNILSAAAYAAVQGLAASTSGVPIFTTDTQNQNLKRMWNTPTFRSDYLSGFGANNVIGMQFSLLGFHMRDAGTGITRYTQVPAKPNQTGIALFSYCGYGYALDNISLLKCPAS